MTVDFLNREMAHRLLRNVHIDFGFLHLFVFELEACTRQTDRQTDGRTDGRARPLMRPTRAPPNKITNLWLQSYNNIEANVDVRAALLPQ